MLHMIELRYPPERREKALEYFWKRGATHYDGKVTLQDAWVATQDRVAYALVRSAEATEVEKACAPLRAFGDVEYREVTSVDEL